MTEAEDKDRRAQRKRQPQRARAKSGGKASAKINSRSGGAIREAAEPPGERAGDIARQLRRMAAGAPPFERFTYTSLWIKRIWRAAAEELDPEVG